MESLHALYLLLAFVILFIAVILFLLFFPESLECPAGDDNCLSRASDLRNRCKPSTLIITKGNSTDYIKLKITVYWDGSKCVIKEEVLEDMNSGMATYDITGHNNTCDLTPEELEKFGAHACNGSLFDFVVSQDSEGGKRGFGDGGPDSDPPHLYCTLNDDDCKNDLWSHIENCMDAEAETEEVIHTENATFYWTLYAEISKGNDSCRIYYEVINIINLPPDYPFFDRGDNMVCEISLFELPIYHLSKRWCSGEIVDYVVFKEE